MDLISDPRTTFVLSRQRVSTTGFRQKPLESATVVNRLFNVLCHIFGNVNCEPAIPLAAVQGVAGVPLA